MNARKIILTGGPCAGKSTMLRELSARGYAVVPEAARLVIERSEKSGGPFPWTDFAAFQRENLALQDELESAVADAHGNVFLDRGALDAAAYCRASGADFPKGFDLESAVRRYAGAVLCEPAPYGIWKADRDANLGLDGKPKPCMPYERVQQMDAAIREAYRSFGLKVWELPFAPHKTPASLAQAVSLRVDRLLEMVGA